MRRARGIVVGMIGALTTVECDGAMSPDGLEPSRAILYGTVTTEDGQPVTMMELGGQLAFGACDQPLTGRLNPALRESVAVESGGYRRELLLDFTPSPQTMCLQATLHESSGSRYDPVEIEVDLRMRPQHERPDSARVDVVFTLD